MPNQCPAAVVDPLAATVAIFIRDTSVIEAVELSNLDSGGSSIDCERMNGALLDAYQWLQSEKLLLPDVCRQVIDMNLSRWMVIVARYFLDNIRRRPDVTADYEMVRTALQDLHKVNASSGNSSTLYSQISATFGKTPVWTQKSLEQYRKQM